MLSVIMIGILIIAAILNILPGVIFKLDSNEISCQPEVLESSGEGKNRHYNSISTFQGDLESKTFTFMGEGSDSSLAVELPENSIIESATVDIEGKYIGGVGGEVITDYTDTVNNKAWEFVNNGQRPPNMAQPANLKANQYNMNDYNAVSNFDGSSKMTQGARNSYPLQLYEFDLSSYYVLNFGVFWTGYYWVWDFDNSEGLNVTIWNRSSSNWEIVGTHYSRFANDHVNIERSFNGPPINYINPVTDILYMAVVGPVSYNQSNMTTRLYTNYISVNITLDPTPLFPEDPFLDVGADGDEDWAYVGELSGEETFSGIDFVNELQEHVDSGGTGGIVNIAFKFGVADRGKLYISNLTIVCITNEGPTCPSNVVSIYFYEDSGWYESTRNVTDYFEDVDDPISNLTYELHGNTSDVWGVITEDYMLNFSSGKNYFGRKEFKISCRDKGIDGIISADDCIVYSSNFNVNVFPSDDPPEITYVNGQRVVDNFFSVIAYEDAGFSLTLDHEDIDGDDIAYSLNITDQALAVDGNIISFQPGQEHVGFFNFTIIGTELNTSDLSDYVDLEIKIYNTNDAPVIESADDIVVDEDVWVNFTVLADDIDLLYDEDEKLTFYTNFSKSDVPSMKWDFDRNNGNFSFLPGNSQVGHYLVNFSVEDRGRKKDWTELGITVNNINDPPVAEPIDFIIDDADEETSKIEKLSVTFQTNTGKDPDLIHGDELAYSWDFDDSDGIDVDAAGQTVLRTYPSAGNYTITLTVSDKMGLKNSTSITIEVFAPIKKEPGDDDDDDVEDDDTGGTGGGGGEVSGSGGVDMWVLIVVAVIAVITAGAVGFIVGLNMMKKKRNDDEDRMNTSPPAFIPLENTPVVQDPEPTVSTSDLAPTPAEGGTPGGQQLPPAETPVTAPPLPTPATSPEEEKPIARVVGRPLPQETETEAAAPEPQTSLPEPPECPKCGKSAQYYPEHKCHWCTGCQDYV